MTEPLSIDRYRECLDADAALFRELVARDMNAAVPSCPGWTVSDLVSHVAHVYLHKAEGMRLGAEPENWPPEHSDEGLALFDRAYKELTAEFDTRDPSQATGTWYTPDQTVGFWIRRMAQETVIHRVDAELAVGATRAPIPADLAIDGIDEVLECFLAFASTGWPSEFGDTLADANGEVVEVTTDGRVWTLRIDPKGVSVTDEASSTGDATAIVGGTPTDVLLWLWRRSGAEDIGITGDKAAVDRLRQLLATATL